MGLLGARRQKWKITSPERMVSLYLLGAIPAFELPLKAGLPLEW
jgi:hypothetical protein